VNSFEGAVECGLIRKSTLRGDIGKGQTRIRHKIFGLVHTPFDQPLVGWLAKGLLEGPGKVAYR
jgi:hypothetical protein